jgi:diguanylate cyclase (GGDEF)-like protein
MIGPWMEPGLDSLTGLLNRAAFLHEFRTALDQRSKVAAVGIDIQYLRAFNDRFGPEDANVIVSAVAKRLAQAAYEGDVVARLGGDEFGVLANCVGNDADELAGLAKDLEDAVSSEPVAVKGDEVHVAVTIRAGLVGSTYEFAGIFDHD